MTIKTAPPRLRFKQAMTATAFALVQCRNVWRTYFAQVQSERRETNRRHQKGWGGG